MLDFFTYRLGQRWVNWGRGHLIGVEGILTQQQEEEVVAFGCTKREISLIVKFAVIWAGIGGGKSFPALGKIRRDTDAMLSIPAIHINAI